MVLLMRYLRSSGMSEHTAMQQILGNATVYHLSKQDTGFSDTKNCTVVLI